MKIKRKSLHYRYLQSVSGLHLRTLKTINGCRYFWSLLGYLLFHIFIGVSVTVISCFVYYALYEIIIDIIQLLTFFQLGFCYLISIVCIPVGVIGLLRIRKIDMEIEYLETLGDIIISWWRALKEKRCPIITFED